MCTTRAKLKHYPQSCGEKARIMEQEWKRVRLYSMVKLMTTSTSGSTSRTGTYVHLNSFSIVMGTLLPRVTALLGTMILRCTWEKTWKQNVAKSLAQSRMQSYSDHSETPEGKCPSLMHFKMCVPVLTACSHCLARFLSDSCHL
jgi:hypothetical protein